MEQRFSLKNTNFLKILLFELLSKVLVMSSILNKFVILESNLTIVILHDVVDSYSRQELLWNYVFYYDYKSIALFKW